MDLKTDIPGWIVLTNDEEQPTYLQVENITAVLSVMSHTGANTYIHTTGQSAFRVDEAVDVVMDKIRKVMYG